MSKKILTILTAVLLVGMSVPAFAAVENVKVGGDITIRGIYRGNYDFIADGDQAQGLRDSVGYVMTTTRIYVTSELSDNVAVVVRLINERDWNAEVAGAAATVDSNEIDLDLAYIKLTDMFTPGLSATLGRQEILLGEGLMIGDVNVAVSPVGLTAWDYGARKAFDAVRLDYEVATIPLTLTGFIAKIIERYNAVATVDRLGDRDLLGINVNYQVPIADAEIEGYFLNLKNAHATKNTVNVNTVDTFGLRGSHNIAAVPGLSYKGEVAFQSGKGSLGLFAAESIKNQGSVLDMGVDYAFQGIAWEPKVGVNYSLYSGDDLAADNKNKGWVVLFPDGLADKVGAIAHRNALIYAGGPTNANILKLSGSAQPTEKFGIGLAWFSSTRDKSTAAADPGLSKDLASEINLGVTYAYSEDVTMGLLYGYLTPGKNVKPVLNSSSAMELVGTVAVSF